MPGMAPIPPPILVIIFWNLPIFFIICCIWPKRLSILFNAATVVPLPAAMKARPLRIYCCGIAPRLVLQVARSHQWPVQLTDELSRADAVLAGRNQLGRDPDLRRRARDGAVPIHVIKADSLPQVQRALERLLRRHGDSANAAGI